MMNDYYVEQNIVKKQLPEIIQDKESDANIVYKYLLRLNLNKSETTCLKNCNLLIKLRKYRFYDLIYTIDLNITQLIDNQQKDFEKSYSTLFFDKNYVENQQLTDHKTMTTSEVTNENFNYLFKILKRIFNYDEKGYKETGEYLYTNPFNLQFKRLYDTPNLSKLDRFKKLLAFIETESLDQLTPLASFQRPYLFDSSKKRETRFYIWLPDFYLLKLLHSYKLYG